MHILLTDTLQCPRCGPGFGLLVLADQIADRRVGQGALGCANCRNQYPIRDGEADLRLNPTAESHTHAASALPAEEEVLRTAALLGVAGGGGVLLLAGTGGAKLAPGIAALVPEVEIALALPYLSPKAAPGTFSRVVAEGVLPFRDRTLRGVALLGDWPAPWLSEAVRTLLPGGRVVVSSAAPEVTAELRALGAQILLDEQRVVVASAVGQG